MALKGLMCSKEAKNKIGFLIEGIGFNTGTLKTAGLAGLGGMLGAGLDLYTADSDTDLGEYARPMAAWGLGGAVGALSLAKSPEDEIADMKRDIKIKEKMQSLKGKL